eukprot:5245174-Pleurochrysis_carterae.AAC.1
MAMSRAPGRGPALSPLAPPASPPPPRAGPLGRRLRREPLAARRPGRGAGCGARRSPGRAASATAVSCMGVKLRKEANRGGRRRAHSTRSRT